MVMIFTLPEDIDVIDKTSESAFRKAIEFQVGIWLAKRKKIMVPRIHTIFLNKVAYYSALQFKKPVSCGWYLYGPYLRNYPEEYPDENNIMNLMSQSNIDIKTNDDAESKKVQTLLDSFFEHYPCHQGQHIGSLYQFLRYIYQTHSQPFPEGKQYYLSKLEVYEALHSQEINPNTIAKKMADYQHELSQTAFRNKIQSSEREISLVIEYGDLIVDAFEKGSISPDYQNTLIKEFSSNVTRIPALRTNIATGTSYDQRTERMWENIFKRRLDETSKLVKNALIFHSKHVYGS
jgi:hypothetical protein